MRCLIDGRVFLDRFPGGVTRVAEELVPAIVKAGEMDDFTLGTTGIGVTGARDVHRMIPNKLVAAATWAHLTSFDRLIPGIFDALFLPNLEMVGRPRIPYALLVHDLSFLIEPRWFSTKTQLWHRVARARELIHGAHALLAVSERTKSDLHRLLGVPLERVETIPLGLTNRTRDEALPSQKHLAHDQPYFLLLGGNDLRKNAACALRALEELRKTADARLIVVGAGFKPAPGISHVSRPSDAELNVLMRDAAALLYPSWYEGFGLPLHEAARFRTPIIASTAGALPETAPSGTVFVPPFKPHLWTQAMRLALKQPAKTTSHLSPDWSPAGRIVVDTLRRIAKGS